MICSKGDKRWDLRNRSSKPTSVVEKFPGHLCASLVMQALLGGNQDVALYMAVTKKPARMHALVSSRVISYGSLSQKECHLSYQYGTISSSDSQLLSSDAHWRILEAANAVLLG
mmetsp:Transcript_63687/g.122439  ORF Transcript_63687/g.122439 Transcript_63687/m.122439 type:complete len:114 (-) Transcript_63687:525-866(-)